MPDYMVTALELSVEDHIAVAAAAQAWVDAAISKTINCPADMPYEDFRQVYLSAYDQGMKGCTTYRPSGLRGAVLSVKEDRPAVPAAPVSSSDVLKRPEVLSGKTIKIKWPIDGENYYLTINDYVHEDGRRVPFEIFISTSSVENFETMAALTRTLSAACRRGDATFLFEELERVHSPKGGALIRLGNEAKGSYAPSLIALIGRILRQHSEPQRELFDEDGEPCPACKRRTAHMQEGCLTCQQCGYSKCG